MYDEILYDVTDPVATITLNRPAQLNAWTLHMGAEVQHAVAQAEEDKRVVGILITGAGRGFCSGADLGVLQDVGEGQEASGPPKDLTAETGELGTDESFRGGFTYLLSMSKPVIAAINGPCVGMAVPFALCCDLRFASDRASIMTAFARRGLIAEWGLSWLLPRLTGTGHALDLLLSGRKIDAAEAERMGLVNRVLPHDDLLGFARRYVEELAAHCSPASMAVMKREVYQHLTASLEDADREAFGLMLESFARPDFREGVASFFEQRPPKFQRI